MWLSVILGCPLNQYKSKGKAGEVCRRAKSSQITIIPPRMIFFFFNVGLQSDLWKEKLYGSALKGCMCVTAPSNETKWLLPSASETSALTSLSHWVEKLYWPQQHSSKPSTHSPGINRLPWAFVHLFVKEYTRQMLGKKSHNSAQCGTVQYRSSVCPLGNAQHPWMPLI